MQNQHDLPPPYTEQPGVHQHYAYAQPVHPTAPQNPGPYVVPPYSAPYPNYPKQPQPAPSYGATNTTTTIIVPNQEVIIVGGCPACRIGVLEDDFTCTGVLCALLFFPIGILCCLAMREKTCQHCGATFSA